DYWEDKVRRPILVDSGADILVYGMGERASIQIANRLKKGERPETMTDIRGTGFMSAEMDKCAFEYTVCAPYEKVIKDKTAYAQANMTQYNEHDPVRGRAIIQKCGERYLIVNPPQMPLTTKEFDDVSELPYTREYHPAYDSVGGVPAIDEVRFSVIHNRGCFGGCNFCPLAFHQGRMVTSRSHESIIREVTAMTSHPLFKGYVHDVGGPTANFRRPSCQKQLKYGMCKGKNCLTPTPCKNLDADHSDYLNLLRKLRQIPGVKKVFIRSGIRFDYLLEDTNNEFFTELVKYHISGQLKVAPEHCINKVLDYMAKPHNEVYNRFMDKYYHMNERYSKQQYLVPYLISSHPGSTMSDAIALAEYLNQTGRQPEQVQDFYPTPGTLSTFMYYTEIDPRTMQSVYVPKTSREKAMQRALLQWKRPEKRGLVISALHEAHREDLIGFGKDCLIRPERGRSREDSQRHADVKKAKPGNKKHGKEKPSRGENSHSKSGHKK
ncbi:MAG: YgiQ family radical SAM protein, partial [Oscillospiraceae bacterium]|nr:YgiQ family radical SAM protein [Oscillospiraceae bacterium]